MATLAGGIANAQTIQTTRFSCDVQNSEIKTILTARLMGIDETVKFEINWLSGKVAPANFRSLEEKKKYITSSHLIEKTTVTRTILASAEADCILIHVIADQPGEVALQARFQSDTPTQIQDRRELVLPSCKIHAHAWIIPFESDVVDDGKGTVSVTGEGEALILLNISENTKEQLIANTWDRLGQRYDPYGTPPNPHVVWEAVKKAQDINKNDTKKE
jgi:hypothetical protein